MEEEEEKEEEVWGRSKDESMGALERLELRDSSNKVCQCVHLMHALVDMTNSFPSRPSMPWALAPGACCSCCCSRFLLPSERDRRVRWAIGAARRQGRRALANDGPSCHSRPHYFPSVESYPGHRRSPWTISPLGLSAPKTSAPTPVRSRLRRSSDDAALKTAGACGGCILRESLFSLPLFPHL